MGETVRGFLTHLKNFYLRNFTEGATLRIVCGNESADLDSVVSAITYAYFSYVKDPACPIVPIINIPRADLALRRDILYVLNQKSIPQDLLYFTEDLQSIKSHYKCSVDSVLVDHNDPQSQAKDLIDRVTGIVDHHEDLGLYGDSIKEAHGPRIVETSGSCSSLVFNYWFSRLGQTVLPVKDALPLSLGAAIIDTSNFQYKVEEPDRIALDRYKQGLPGFDITDYYNSIRSAKDNIDGLDLRDVLRKDYKEFEFNNTRKDTVKIGIASVVKSLGWLEESYKESAFKEISLKFLEERSQDILMILTSWSEEGTFKRQVSFIAHSEHNSKLCDSIIDKVSNRLELKEIQIFDNPSFGFRFFNQLNTAASRKQVAPYVKFAVESL